MSAAFAFQLAQLRRAAGVSQRKAAADLQVSQALLSHYEKGIREPGLDFVVRAADYYHVSCDLLLGRRDTIRQSELLRTAAPSQYARETERDIRNTLDIVFDLLSRCYDPNVFCYASIYVSEVLYELLRHLSRISGDCVLEHYSLTDEAFDSGAVVGDITLARARYILATASDALSSTAIKAPQSAPIKMRTWKSSLPRPVRRHSASISRDMVRRYESYCAALTSGIESTSA